MDERIVAVLQKPWVIPTTVGVASAAVGFAGGYFFHKWRTSNVQEEYEQLQLDFEAKAMEEAEYIAAEISSAEEEAAEILGEILDDEVASNVVPLEDRDVVVNPRRDPSDIQIEAKEEDVPIERVNIFDHDDDWNYEKETMTRTPGEPYVIHVDEFQGDEMGYDSQSTLTYYEKDGILTDEQNVPIYNPHQVVGELKFGHGSNDPNVVYIRNEKMKAEYEVLRDPSSYELEVLGYDAEEEMENELKHSRHQVMKFREE